jgi:hypothetical protein
MGRTKAKRRLHPKHVHTTGALMAILSITVIFSTTSSHELLQAGRDMMASASVGMGANVAPNEHNTLAAQLVERERALAAREAELLAEANRWDSTDVLALSGVVLSALVLLLVLLNFFFDFKRNMPRALAVDLRRT